MTRTGNKRYICSFVKEDENGELKPNVVVVAAPNSLIARAVLCEKYKVKNKSASRNNTEEGVKTIRESDTNKYEGETEDESFVNEGSNT